MLKPKKSESSLSKSNKTLTKSKTFNLNTYTEYTSLCEYQLQHYKKKNIQNPSKIKNYQKIENWLESSKSKNSPLIIKTTKNESQKIFITNWIYYHLKNSQKNYKDIIIPNFVNYQTKESSQFYIIYNIITKLREIFNIKRNVDNSEENLRMNFEYWLDLVSRKIEKNSFFDGNLIILIEGANLIIDDKSNLENNIKFWLPKIFPDRIKFIIILEENSFNLNYFENFGCEIFNFITNRNSVMNFLNDFENKKNLKEIFFFF